MHDNSLRTLSRALTRSGVGTYSIVDDAVLKAGGLNLDRQAWSGIAIRLDHGEAYVVELELTLDHHCAETADEARADLERNFIDAVTEPFDISHAEVDPIWGHWSCTVSRRLHGIDETIQLVLDMLEWGF